MHTRADGQKQSVNRLGGEFDAKGPNGSGAAADPFAASADDRDWGSLSLKEGSRTPWGEAQTVDHIADGIAIATTAGHGGVKLSPQRNREVPAPLRERSGWYEEDCGWYIPAYTFPDELASQPHISDSPDELRASAEDRIKQWYPSKWEELTGETLEPGESYEKDAIAWAKRHEHSFVTNAASYAKTDPNLVLVHARRAADGTDAEYLVPKDEYDERNNGDLGRNGRFVIDPERHPKLPPKDPHTGPYARPKPTPTPGLYREDGSPILAEGKNAERINADLERLWRGRDGSVRSLREELASGVRGKSVFSSGKTPYFIQGKGDSAFPISKATWDYLDQVPDTRKPSEIALRAYSNYGDIVHREWLPSDSQREKLAELKAAYERAEAAERPAAAAKQAEYIALEEARERAAKVEDSE